MKKLAFVLLAFTAGVSACSDDPTPPAQSASGVFPAQAFLGRKVRVEISGDNTEWADGATVSFGDGITVDTVTVSSPTAIFADITVSDTAAEGAHDVTVTNGDDAVTLTKAFQLLSPIEVTTGPLAQGAITLVTIKTRDLENLFDTTSTGDGVFTPLVFTNIAITGPAGVTFQVDNVTPFDIEAIALVDVDAATAGGSLTVKSGPTGKEISSPGGAALAITARTATAVTPGTPSTGQLVQPYDSALYSLSVADGPALVNASITGGLRFAVLPASGHFDDLIAATTAYKQILKNDEKLYLIPFDLSGASGTSFSLNSATGPKLSTTVADTEPGNNASAGATAIAMLPAFVDDASLPNEDDVDWFKITVPVGKSIHVVTTPGDASTDTIVEVFGPGNATTSFGGESDDLDYHEDWTTDPTTVAGTYYVKISASHAGYYDPAQSKYRASITLE